MKSQASSDLRLSPRTLGTSMIARVIERVSAFSVPSCRTVSLTVVPGRPVRTSTALSGFMPSVDWPSISMIRSPARTPASYAGVPTIGAITLRRLASGSMPTWMPIPPNRPSICRLNCFHSVVLMYDEWGSRFWSIPFRALSSSSRRSTGRT